MTKRLQDLLDEANAAVKAITADEAKEILAAGDSVFVDLREESELQRNGIIPGSVHVPRGLLEWALDPDTTYSVEAFQTGQRVVLYCSHGKRSAMSAKLAYEMGAENVVHLKDGFVSWKNAGGEIAPYSGGA
jgi:rhodanese-related sulfurtransferase